ncbi:MAG: hypothetical protein GXP45_00235 [bacterium]|nr:hypothetical protein [bacterium]
MKKSLSNAFKTIFGVDVKDIQFKDLQGGLKGFILKIVIFIEKNKHNARLVAPFALASILLAGFFVLRIHNQLKELNFHISTLHNLDEYDLGMLDLNTNTRKQIKNLHTVDELMDYYHGKQDDTQRYRNYLSSLKIPYDNLLQYFYLPSLNIWKDKYLGTIDENLIGRKFLENNPYDDIVLLQKWTDFFKQVGQNESNQVTNISIGDIKELGDGTFRIPIDVSFISSSKRAFLLLVDKISLTSNSDNISLINEFMYQLWNEIKKNKMKEVYKLAKQIIGEYPDTFGTNNNPNYDKIIGYSLYQWVKNGGPNTLIDQSILLKTMNNLVPCENANPEICFYQFREKYRGIPYLAYLFK